MRTVCLCVASFSLLALPAFADAIFTVGNNPQPNEENVLFSTNQSAATVFGETNQSMTSCNSRRPPIRWRRRRTDKRT